ncbi:MAG: hypothetical protein ABF633_19510 [Clostridium sp.]
MLASLGGAGAGVGDGACITACFGVGTGVVACTGVYTDSCFSSCC